MQRRLTLDFAFFAARVWLVVMLARFVFALVEGAPWWVCLIRGALAAAAAVVCVVFPRGDRWPHQDEIPTYPAVTYGWRIWTHEAGRPKRLLKAWSSGTHWPPLRRNEAACTRGHDHEAPARDCSCGIYALKNEDALFLKSAFFSQSHVVGRVALWGRILEFSKGYRAQYAYPVELWCQSFEIGHELAEAYRVPVHTPAGTFRTDPERSIPWTSASPSVNT